VLDGRPTAARRAQVCRGARGRGGRRDARQRGGRAGRADPLGGRVAGARRRSASSMLPQFLLYIAPALRSAPPARAASAGCDRRAGVPQTHVHVQGCLPRIVFARARRASHLTSAATARRTPAITECKPPRAAARCIAARAAPVTRSHARAAGPAGAGAALDARRAAAPGPPDRAPARFAGRGGG